jgi:hypothetical protein
MGRTRFWLAEEAQSARVGLIESTVSCLPDGCGRWARSPPPPRAQGTPGPFPCPFPSLHLHFLDYSLRPRPRFAPPSSFDRRQQGTHPSLPFPTNQARALPPLLPRETEREGSALLFPDSTPRAAAPPTSARSAGCPGCRFLGKPRGPRPLTQFRSPCDPGPPNRACTIRFPHERPFTALVLESIIAGNCA